MRVFPTARQPGAQDDLPAPVLRERDKGLANSVKPDQH